MTPHEELKPIRLGERLFRAARATTAKRDDWIQSRVYFSGVKKLKQEEGESAEDYAERLTAHLQRSEQTNEILGGILTPAECEDLAWTPAIALETAAHIENLHRPEDKEQRNVILLTLLLDHFVDGLRPSSDTGSSSATPAAPQPSGA